MISIPPSLPSFEVALERKVIKNKYRKCRNTYTENHCEAFDSTHRGRLQITLTSRQQ